jgi:hypothetical protein
LVGKDDFVFNKSSLIKTSSGRKILLEGSLKTQGYKQFKYYRDLANKEFPIFTNRFTNQLRQEIISDKDPTTTLKSFCSAIGDDTFLLDDKKAYQIRTKIVNDDYLLECIKRLLNSNFIKMTFHIFYALFDSYQQYVSMTNGQGQGITMSNVDDLKVHLIDGHVIAIDLSEPMDRVQDKDEDLNYLDEYKIICPYILNLARKKISYAGPSVVNSFEKGFRDARIGQGVDNALKQDISALDDEMMIACYKKYRAVMGTAGQNMALNNKPLSTIFYIGMARASESVGCGNEIQDSIKNEYIKVPSWPLLYSLLTGSSKKGFELTLDE